MKILKSIPQVISKERVQEGLHIYRRTVFDNGRIDWNPLSYDGECDEEELEAKYQLLLQAAVQVEKENNTKQKEKPKKVMYPALRSCFMTSGKYSVPIISGHVESRGDESCVTIRVTTDHSKNRTTVILNLDGTYLIV